MAVIFYEGDEALSGLLAFAQMYQITSAHFTAISRGKQRSHMEVRRATNEEPRALKGTSVEADADVVESRAKDRILALARSSFKKLPDAPLGVVVARKVKRRAEHATGRKSR